MWLRAGESRYDAGMSKKALIWGGVSGLVAPVVGLFVGLQVSPMLANVLMFPIIGLAAVSGGSFGQNPSVFLVGIVLSVVVWALVFGIVAKLLKRG